MHTVAVVGCLLLKKNNVIWIKNSRYFAFNRCCCLYSLALHSASYSSCLFCACALKEHWRANKNISTCISYLPDIIDACFYCRVFLQLLFAQSDFLFSHFFCFHVLYIRSLLLLPAWFPPRSPTAIFALLSLQLHFFIYVWSYFNGFPPTKMKIIINQKGVSRIYYYLILALLVWFRIFLSEKLIFIVIVRPPHWLIYRRTIVAGDARTRTIAHTHTLRHMHTNRDFMELACLRSNHKFRASFRIFHFVSSAFYAANACVTYYFPSVAKR